MRCRKRPRDDSTAVHAHEDSDRRILWKEALEDIERKLSVVPVINHIKGQKSALCLEGVHVPLLQVSIPPTKVDCFLRERGLMIMKQEKQT